MLMAPPPSNWPMMVKKSSAVATWTSELPRTGFSFMNVFAWPATLAMRLPETKVQRSMTCTPRAPLTPPPLLRSCHQEKFLPRPPMWSKNWAFTWRTAPMAPEATMSRAACVAFRKRSSWSMMAIWLGLLAASATMVAASSALTAVGLSDKRCLPARKAAMACSAWRKVGETTETTSTSGQPQRASMESKAWGTPRFEANCSAFALSRE
mmetsp:Transcript_6098/g.16559  ORF Transcript_6098/g.16559 Transcript_6098/m.16559 type:complete len:209 (+) Transcript_6098:347-973(+)